MGTQGSRTGRKFGFTYQTTVAAGASETWLVPAGNTITVAALPASATATVYYTTSPESAVAGGTATWHTWSPGAVTSNTAWAIVAPITALKFASTTGNTVFEVCG